MAVIAAVLVACLGGGGVLTSSAVAPAGASAFVAITPCRLMDTRAGAPVGPRNTPIGASETYVVSVWGANGKCTIPSTATAVSLNATFVSPSAAGWVSLYPADKPWPGTSNLNFNAGQAPAPNAVTSALSADGKLAILNFAGTVDLIVDVVGYYADHNHDDRYYTKAQSDAHLAGKANAADVYSKAQSDAQLAGKANAADVYTKAQINGLPSSTVVAAGSVTAAGLVGPVATFAPRFGDNWTVGKFGTGVYLVTMPGLNPGCLDPLLPLMFVSSVEFSAGFQEFVNFGSVNCGSGNTSVQINTYNVAGAAADRGFTFIAYRPGNNQILPASAHPSATECIVSGDNVDCH